jgi:hypothetical protein
MKMYALDEIKGKKGTKERDKVEKKVR